MKLRVGDVIMSTRRSGSERIPEIVMRVNGKDRTETAIEAHRLTAFEPVSEDYRIVYPSRTFTEIIGHINLWTDDECFRGFADIVEEYNENFAEYLV